MKVVIIGGSGLIAGRRENCPAGQRRFLAQTSIG